MGYGKTILLMAAVTVSTLAMHYAWFHERTPKEVEALASTQIGSGIQVPCDAFDVYIVPHDGPSIGDAREAAMEYEMNVRCRDGID